MLLGPSIMRVIPTYDNEGCISSVVHYQDGTTQTHAYQTTRRPRVEKCPFCTAPLYRAAIQQRMYCMNNECPPRVQGILQQQLDRLGLSPSHLNPLLQATGWIGNVLGPGTRNLIMVANSHPDAAVRATLVGRIKSLSFTDFLMMLHVPYGFISQIEDDLSHCVSLNEVYEALMYSTTEGVASPEAFFAGKLALTINAAYALTLLDHNRSSRPTWSEGS